MKIKLSDELGFCYGVERAVSMAVEMAKSGPVYTLGPLMHNARELRRLELLGIIPIKTIGDLPPGRKLIIRSHGTGRQTLNELKDAGIDYADATCPRVARIHNIVEEQDKNGVKVIIIGKNDHPEVRGIAGWCTNPLIFSGPDEIKRYSFDKEIRYAVVSQTTVEKSLFKECQYILKKECTNLEFFDTICNVTDLRNKAAVKLASECDAMVVVGDTESSNTMRLVEVCLKACPHVFFADGFGSLDRDRLFYLKSSLVGVAAGTSAPMWVIQEVVNKMADLINEEQLTNGVMSDVPVEAEGVTEGTEASGVSEDIEENEQSFADMLEASIKTLNTGEKVTGVITSINSNELNVDLGTKHAGYIPLDEISDDPSVKLSELFTVGQEIEAYVLRVNDAEGTAMLSKKRLDMVKGWEDLEGAYSDRLPVEGIVVEENKGGVVVSVKGVRVFVPASQTGVPKDVPLSTIMKKRVKLKITEANRGRRRMVGSIRAYEQESRRGLSDKVWEEIEVGKKYDGIVKSLTAYGAFIDIGGVDGMVHISELSWGHPKHPSEVLNTGDKVSVHVLSFDKEKKRISLGYRREEDNPWNKFIAAYKIDDVANVKIVKLMPFGAFAEISEGVDGLIHISQITDRHIARPGDVLSEGQMVDVKITDIDLENKKISLSIRALMEKDAPEEALDGPDAIVAIANENETIAPDYEDEETE